MSRAKEVLLGGVLLGIDQLTKAWALSLTSVVSVLPILNFRLAYNKGASFSMLSDGHDWQYWFLVSVAILACALITKWWTTQQNAIIRLALTLIFVGALGNLIDRLRFGAVVDFIDLHWQGWHFPTFNVADTAITIGAFIVLFFYRQD